MSRVDLPDGGWAELAAPKKVSERKRRRYIHAMTEFNKSTQTIPRDAKGELDPTGFGGVQQDLLDAALDLLTVALVTAWSYEAPIAIESLEDFPVDVFDAIRRACNDLAPQLMPDLVSPDPDPKAITGDSQA